MGYAFHYTFRLLYAIASSVKKLMKVLPGITQPLTQYLPDPQALTVAQAPQYQAWCTGQGFNTNSSNYDNIDNTPFWTNQKCIQLYKDHVKAVLTRSMSCQLLLPSSMIICACNNHCLLFSIQPDQCSTVMIACLCAGATP
jgi:hypothetical protein